MASPATMAVAILEGMHRALLAQLPILLLVVGCAPSSIPRSQEPGLVGEPPAKERTNEGVGTPNIVFVEADEEEVPLERSRGGTGFAMWKERITLDVREADVRDVLRVLAEQGDVNIVVDEGVMGTVTLRLRNVTVEEAFFAVLQARGLGATEMRGTISASQ